MSELAKLEELIASASAALENSADGHLSRANRRDIVDALGERLGPAGPPSNAIGYLRRVRLAVLGIEKVHGSFWTHCDEIDSFAHFSAALVGYGATDALGVSIWDWAIEGTDDREHPPDEWDTALYAAAAWAGGFPGQSGSDRNRRLEFWKWWLREAIPYATHDGLWNQVIPKDSESA